MSDRHDDEASSFQEDTFGDDEIEILEIVGLDEDSPSARPVVEDDPTEVLLRFDEKEAAASETSPAVEGGEAPPADPDATPANGAWDPESVERERERYLRLQADFENFKRRTDRERVETERRAASGILDRLLPVLDNFERAISSDPRIDQENGTFRDGVALIFKQLLDELRREGLTSIDTIGQPFDPYLHEAVATDLESGLPTNTIVEELRRGYLLQGRVLRPSLVKVAVDPRETRTAVDDGEES